jgi:hypothetical protein
MTPLNLCWFQNNSTRKYRLLCLESTDNVRCLWETSDLDQMPEPRTDTLSVVVRRPATYADYVQRRDETEANGYTIVTQQ